ncbi:hypothetical protein DS831_04590 [Bombilactobacillus bombi]|uniref:Uncharacterized protein n=1 Tax=Bombilactobacillus bombi TaxID=1303590 RepID=A0A3R7CPP5_9LACO|nr:hypothetical protein [Bombilactobacillus bombi]RHW51303.1 hypothetical protein DS831_04590 [Bombilactobacillus bombi]
MDNVFLVGTAPDVCFCALHVDRGMIYEQDSKLYRKKGSALKRLKYLNDHLEANEPDWQLGRAKGWLPVEN